MLSRGIHAGDAVVTRRPRTFFGHRDFTVPSHTRLLPVRPAFPPSAICKRGLNLQSFAAPFPFRCNSPRGSHSVPGDASIRAFQWVTRIPTFQMKKVPLAMTFHNPMPDRPCLPPWRHSGRRFKVLVAAPFPVHSPWPAWAANSACRCFTGSPGSCKRTPLARQPSRGGMADSSRLRGPDNIGWR